MTMRAASQPSVGSAATLNQSSGTATPVANGVITVFNITHGLGRIPTNVIVNGGNALSSATRIITWDATNITITYLVAPLTGTLSLRWTAIG